MDKGLELPVPGTSRVLHFATRHRASEDGDFSPTKRRRWRTYICGALVGIAFVGLYVHSSRDNTAEQTVGVFPEVEHLEEEARTGPERTLAADGTFLADLGSVANEAYHLGPTNADE